MIYIWFTFAIEYDEPSLFLKEHPEIIVIIIINSLLNYMSSTLEQITSLELAIGMSASMDEVMEVGNAD